MRKLLFIIFSFCSIANAFCQSPDDVLKNAWFIPNGTARSNAIGGAMGALGGDITSAYTNPAGLGFYKTSEFVISPELLMVNNKSDYRGTSLNNIKKSGFQLGTSGLVIGGKINQSNKSTAFSISINQLASYNNKIQYEGVNNYSSYSEQYLEQLVADNANVNGASNNYPFGASLAFFTYLIDSITSPSGTLAGYRSLVPVADGIKQQYNETDGGGLYEISLGFASNAKDKVYLGGSINIPLSFYKQNLNYEEFDMSSDQHNNFNYSSFTQDHTINGAGLNGRFGIIYKPQPSLRLGLAFHTPSYMSYTDKLNAVMTTDTEDYAGVVTSKSSDFSNAASEVHYNEITPYKIIASAAYVFNEVEDVRLQKGFITADAEFVNHRGSRFIQQSNDDGTDDPSASDYYKSLNDAIKAYYKGAFDFRIGGELKFSPLAIRLGAAYYGSPYSDKTLKANRILAAGGVGYRNHGMFVDLTVSEIFNKDVNFPYRLTDKANTFATLNNRITNVLLTVGIKF